MPVSRLHAILDRIVNPYATLTIAPALAVTFFVPANSPIGVVAAITCLLCSVACLIEFLLRPPAEIKKPFGD